MVPTFIGVFKVIIVVSMCKSRRVRWVGHAACMEEKNVRCVFVGKPEGNIPLGM